MTCADVDEKIDLVKLDLDDIDAVDLVAEDIHRTHYNSKEEETHSSSEDEDLSYNVLRQLLYVLCMYLQKKMVGLLKLRCILFQSRQLRSHCMHACQVQKVYIVQLAKQRLVAIWQP